MTELDRLRQEYEAHGLDVADVVADPIRQFNQWFTEVREAGYYEPDAMVVSTVDAQGSPDARTVLMRGLDELGFVFFTNYTSAKARQIDAAPRAALTFTWSAVRRQVRVVGAASRVGEVESDVYFAGRPRGSQLAAWASDQSEVIASRAELDARYAEVEHRFHGRDIPRPPDWGGYRVQPDVVEFWQGRENRLHDRLRYTRDATGAWLIARLAP